VDASWEAAIRNGSVESIRAMLETGADVDSRDAHGQTGLMLSARAGNRDVVELLIAHGAALDVVGKFGLSALMLAVVNKHAEVARLLVRAGADRSLRGSGAPGFAGKTARDLALAGGMDALAAELAAKGSA